MGKKKDIFSFAEVLNYIITYFKRLSTKGVYSILLLFYAYKSGKVPSWAKKIIIGSIAYFVSPIDSIPDLTPFIGMTDDLSVISYGLVTIACYIDDDVRGKAKIKLQHLLKDKVAETEVAEVDNWL